MFHWDALFVVMRTRSHFSSYGPALLFFCCCCSVTTSPTSTWRAVAVVRLMSVRISWPLVQARQSIMLEWFWLTTVWLIFSTRNPSKLLMSESTLDSVLPSWDVDRKDQWQEIITAPSMNMYVSIYSLYVANAYNNRRILDDLAFIVFLWKSTNFSTTPAARKLLGLYVADEIWGLVSFLDFSFWGFSIFNRRQ